jgi:FkbH-like protein
MIAKLTPFSLENISRITQLINKSNQFNLTTKRLNELDVIAIMECNNKIHFTIRLSDKFSDHGLISVVIAEIKDSSLIIELWLMSCRVLKRNVEEVALDELIELGKLNLCRKIIGKYYPTPKNNMVKHHYKQLGFELYSEGANYSEYHLNINQYEKKPTPIQIIARSYE